MDRFVKRSKTSTEKVGAEILCSTLPVTVIPAVLIPPDPEVEFIDPQMALTLRMREDIRSRQEQERAAFKQRTASTCITGFGASFFNAKTAPLQKVSAPVVYDLSCEQVVYIEADDTIEQKDCRIVCADPVPPCNPFFLPQPRINAVTANILQPSTTKLDMSLSTLPFTRIQNVGTPCIASCTAGARSPLTHKLPPLRTNKPTNELHSSISTVGTINRTQAAESFDSSIFNCTSVGSRDKWLLELWIQCALAREPLGTSGDIVADPVEESSSTVCGNSSTEKQLTDWLEHILQRRLAAQQRKGGRRRRKHSTWSSDDDEDSGGVVAVLQGPSGVGKTAMVHAVARRLGVEVLEIHTGLDRSGASLRKRVQEATKSRALSDSAAQTMTLILYDEVRTLPGHSYHSYR